MVLTIDVGNSNTVLGLFEGAVLVHQLRITTASRTADELGLLLVQLLRHHGVEVAALEGVAVGTVVPAALHVIEAASRRYLQLPARVIDPTLLSALPIRLAEPVAVGPDRLINVVAARERFSPPYLVIDFGTATTFDAVDASGAFIGGAIAPGLGISAEALSQRTARLPRVEIERPTSAIGTNTRAAMLSGLFWGYVGLVDGLAGRIKAEMGGKVPCLATGGLSGLVGPACVEVDAVDPELTLHGLRICYEKGGYR